MHENKSTSESERIELLSDDVQEIFGAVPSWIVRWGIVVILTVVIGMIAASFVFKYPDIITSSAVIISKNPPAALVAKTNGRIDVLSIQNGERVKPEQVLAVLENAADHQHVFQLKNKLKEIAPLFLTDTIRYLPQLEEHLSLGSIQSSFSSFQRQYVDYINFLQLRLIEKKITSAKQRIRDHILYVKRLKMQVISQEQSLYLSKVQLERDSLLFARGVVAASDYERSKQNYFQALSNHQNMMASVDNANMELNQLNYQQIDLESQLIDQRQQIITKVIEALENVNAAIAEWENSYAIIAPIDGTVTFNKYWSAHQYVDAGDVVFTVLPSETQNIVGRVKIPVSGSGKVKVGQMVQIRLDNYPHTEFGILEGTIASVSLVPEESEHGFFYNAEVIFPNGLTTNYKQVLPFSQQLRGQADVITNSLTLFERFINPLRSVWNNSV